MKQIVKNFNNLIKKTIFKVQNKTNINLKIGNLNIIKRFNNWIEKTIFRVQNKSINKVPISKFNKYLITFISLLFFYLFYLLVPLLYDKAWVQKNIENKILSEFKINLSTSADISYRILPAPHFLIKNSKILLDDSESQKSIADIKNLKFFLSQKNLLNKEKMNIKKLVINNANFFLLRDEIIILNDYSNNKFSNKKITINDSNIFLKNSLDEIFTIIKIEKSILFFDYEKQINLFNLKGNIFGAPFTFALNSKNNSVLIKEINLESKSLKLKFFNESIEKNDGSKSGKNIILYLNNTIQTKYNIKDKLITFANDKDKLKILNIKYNGELSINPFDLNFYIDLGNYRISKLFNYNSILKEFIKSGVLFNDNFSLDGSIVAKTNARDQIFQNAIINFNIVNGKLNLNNTTFTNKKIGLLKLDNSNLFVENNELVLNTDVLISIKDSQRLFSTLNTNKKSRNEIKNIFINLDYNFLENQIKFNNVKVDSNDVSVQFLNILEDFNDNDFNNIIKSRRLINNLFDVYDG